jgi:hypothetical protein
MHNHFPLPTLVLTDAQEFSITLYIQGKRSLGKNRHRREDNTEIHLKRETECKGVDWILLLHNRVQQKAFVNTGMKVGAQ